MANHALPQSPQEHLKSMNILYLALLGGQLMMFVMLYFAFETPEEAGNDVSVAGGFDIITIAMIFFFVSAAGMSFFLYNKRKQEGQNLKSSLMEKLTHYRSSFILRLALLEGANLTMLLIYFFVSKNMIFLILFGLGIALFLMARPTVDRIVQDYQLSGSEQRELSPSHF